jgi:Leucine-rich repeat (LRR) protein
MPSSSSSNLNLWRKQLGHIPDSVWQQSELETLILADNNLSELSGKIGHLKMLRMLDLGHNELTQLPDEIGGLPNLTNFLPARQPFDLIAVFV